MTMHLTSALIHALPFSDRRVCNRDEAASYVGVSAGKFDKMVTEGAMPKPLRYQGVRRWDKTALDHAISKLGGVSSGQRATFNGDLAHDNSNINEWDEVIVDGQERPTAKRH